MRFPVDYTKRMVDKDGNLCWEAVENIVAVGGMNRNNRAHILHHTVSI